MKVSSTRNAPGSTVHTSVTAAGPTLSRSSVAPWLARRSRSARSCASPTCSRRARSGAHAFRGAVRNSGWASEERACSWKRMAARSMGNCSCNRGSSSSACRPRPPPLLGITSVRGEHGQRQGRTRLLLGAALRVGVEVQRTHGAVQHAVRVRPPRVRVHALLHQNLHHVLRRRRRHGTHAGARSRAPPACTRWRRRTLKSVSSSLWRSLSLTCSSPFSRICDTSRGGESARVALRRAAGRRGRCAPAHRWRAGPSYRTPSASPPSSTAHPAPGGPHAAALTRGADEACVNVANTPWTRSCIWCPSAAPRPGLFRCVWRRALASARPDAARVVASVGSRCDVRAVQLCARARIQSAGTGLGRARARARVACSRRGARTSCCATRGRCCGSRRSRSARRAICSAPPRCW